MSEILLYIAAFPMPINCILFIIKRRHNGATSVAILRTRSHIPKLAKHASCLKDIAFARGLPVHIVLRRWSSNPSAKCSYERPTRGTVGGTMRSMCGADAGCLAINYQSLHVVPPLSSHGQILALAFRRKSGKKGTVPFTHGFPRGVLDLWRFFRVRFVVPRRPTCDRIMTAFDRNLARPL